MSFCRVVGELVAVLGDARACGDLAGHLAAWWAVVRGTVGPATRAGVVVTSRGAL